ncbi:leucine-rich repeat domain-containing protein [Bacteroides heparinolyticus]|uniref:leucine-rich repeat domain-containing protein n=4 Tax=Prevotella heparinolytica TaxID=28113 RepID=UPI00359F69CD
MEAIVNFKDDVAMVVYSNDYTGMVTIPDYDNKGRPVTAIAEGAFLNCKKVTEVRLGRNIEFVGDSAFEGCENLETITLNDRVRSIGKFAFFNCKSLTSIELKYGVGKIGRSAFQNCEALKNITLHYGVSEIAPWTFAGCKQLKSVDIPNGVKHIGHQAFAECVMLEKIETLSSNTSLGYEVFLGVKPKCAIAVPLYCDEKYKTQAQWNNFDIRVNDERIFSFNGIRYKEKESNVLLVARNEFFYGHAKLDAEISFMGRDLVVKEIEEQAFARNDSLVSVYVPASIECIGTGAFAACAKLQYFTADNVEDCNFEAKNGVLFSKSGDTLVAYPAANDKTAFSIPATVAKIADYAFSSFQSLERITFCNKEVGIGEYVFLEAAVGNCCAFVPKDADTLKKKLSSIGFKEIVDSDAITAGGINYKILTDGEEGGTVEVAKNPDYVGKVVIPETIEYAGVKYAVAGVGDQAFDSNTKVTSVSLPNNIKFVGVGAFQMLRIPMSLPSSLERVAEAAFTYNLFDDLRLPLGLKEVGRAAFGYTTVKTGRAYVPVNVNTMKGNPFHGSTIEVFIVDAGNRFFKSEDGVLFSKDGRKLLVYPHEKKGDTYTIPNGVTTIGDESFENNHNLTQLIIPATVNKLEKWALRSCSSLKTIVVQNTTPPAVGDRSFNGVDANCVIVVPKDCVSKYKEAEGWKQFINIVDEVIPAFNCKGVNYKIISFEERTVEVDENISFAGKLQIPPEVEYAGEKFTVKRIGEKAFKNNKTLTYIKLPFTICEIGKEAFSCASSLKKLVIPENVATIYSSAFYKLNISEIYVMSKNPPTILQGEISNIIVSCTLYIPKKTILKYNIKMGWRKFASIKEIPDLRSISSGVGG